MSYDNTNTGIFFKNTNKQKDTHPDMEGSINVDGKDYWLKGWVKEGKNGKLAGKKFYSLTLSPKDEKPKDEKPKDEPIKNAADKASNNLDDDLPF